MKNWQIENSEKSEISETLKKVFRVLFFQVFDLAFQLKSRTQI